MSWICSLLGELVFLYHAFVYLCDCHTVVILEANTMEANAQQPQATCAPGSADDSNQASAV
jgi:hypothetical protein